MDEASEPDLLARLRSRVERGLSAIPFVSGRARSRSEAADLLAQLALLLAQWAPRMNLTGHETPSEIVDRLILDAAALVGAVPELVDSASVTDLGSGAGFPGLPISVLCPASRVTLVESRLKRHHFQREARRRLRLENARPLLGRAEEMAGDPSEVVIAQAMAAPTEALALMRPWSIPGGLLILPAAEGAVPPTLPEALAGALVESRSYRVPGSEARDRLLWLVRLSQRP